MNWEILKPELKKIFYKSPFPLFIWGEETPHQEILTAATFYWSIHEEIKNGDYLTHDFDQSITLRNLPKLFCTYLHEKTNGDLNNLNIEAKDHYQEEAINIESRLAKKNLFELFDKILDSSFMEVHFKI